MTPEEATTALLEELKRQRVEGIREVFVEEESEAYLKIFLLERVYFHDDEDLVDMENKQEYEVSNEAWEEMRNLAKS